MPKQLPEVIISLQINRRLLFPRSLPPCPPYYTFVHFRKRPFHSIFSFLPTRLNAHSPCDFSFSHFEVVIYFMYKFVYLDLRNYKVVASLARLLRFLFVSCYR
uniref:Expressed protein n=1 Tax=Echinococcus granulosus TaxID=6210 RepID=A0A068WHM6_ECHGR|nr:expressed protein [Echinococcus granulosus]